MKKVLFGLLSLTLIVATSCKKDKDAPAFTKETVAGAYVTEKVTFKYGSNEQDITAGFFEPCELDDIVTLNINFTYDSQDAGVECSGDFSGTWGIPAANKFEMDGTTYDVASWDGTNLSVSEAYDFGGNSGTIIFYMKKK
jgi:hypothetical protein